MTWNILGPRRVPRVRLSRIGGLRMRFRTCVQAALAFSMAAGAAAQDKDAPRDMRERGGYWSSLLSDFFLGPEQKDEFRWSGRITPGATLEVKGINGRIQATPAVGREIELVALKRGRRHDPKLVEIEFVEHAGGLTICAVYP